MCLNSKTKFTLTVNFKYKVADNLFALCVAAPVFILFGVQVHYKY